MNNSNNITGINSGTAMADENRTNSLHQYLHQLSGQEKDIDIIMIDHCYAKSWTSHCDTNHAKPARMLFMKSISRQTSSSQNSDMMEIDVETVPQEITPAYDTPKTRSLMAECDRFLKNSMNHDLEEDEDRLNKAGWTPIQNRLYKSTMKVIQGLRLARLSYEGTTSEPVRRREAVNISARRLRQVFSGNNWDMTLLCWLHKILMDNLSEQLLSEYLEILRTLKAKIPTLIDKLMLHVSPFHTQTFGSAVEQFNQLLKKNWDPVSTALNQQKPKKLPGNALILVVPSSPNQPPISASHRSRFWNSELSCLGKVIHVSAHSVSGVHRIAVDECLDQIFSITRNKVTELKAQNPNRPVILVGWMIGALIACHVALEEEVTAVVCFGFPLTGVGGSRGDLDDPLLDSEVPTLFVIGQNASTCSMDDIEDFRERMKAETGLVIIGGADDMLRVSATKKKIESITQSMVDRCLIDEISDFLTSILSPQYGSPPHVNSSKRSSQINSYQSQPQTSHYSSANDAKRKRRKPREYSPEISPVRRKPRINRQNLQKVSISSTSSETSSTGSCASKNISAHKEVKKVPSSKVGRPPTNVLYKKPIPKTIRRPKTPEKIEMPRSSKTDGSSKDIPNSKNEETETSLPPVEAKLDPTKELRLVNQQKNVPVDVEKAFGKDSSFLPRPLTPPDIDGETFSSVTSTSPAQKAEESMENTTAVDSATVSPQSRPKIVSVTPASLASLLGAPGHKISYLKPMISDSPAISTPPITATQSLPKPPVVAKISETPVDRTKGQIHLIEKLQYHNFPLSANSASAKTTPSTKIITTTGLNIKTPPQRITIDRKNLVSPSPSTLSSVTTGISSMQAGNTTTYYVSAPDPNSSKATKTVQFRRMVMKGSTVPTNKVPFLPKATTSGSMQQEQQACNLSLLSEIAGMKEPIPQEGQSSTGATLVKLTSVKEPQTVKRMRVVEVTPTMSQRIETPEEQAEKQMAIRALNNSLEGDKDTYSPREPNYSYFSRTDHTFMSRSSSSSYSLMMPQSSLSYRGKYLGRRGRGRPATSIGSRGRRGRIPQIFFP